MKHGYRLADADRPGHRTKQNRRERDIEFLAAVRNATYGELVDMLAKCLDVPWKVVAIDRAILRETTK
jgi:hypothetical protein